MEESGWSRGDALWKRFSVRRKEMRLGEIRLAAATRLCRVSSVMEMLGQYEVEWAGWAKLQPM